MTYNHQEGKFHFKILLNFMFPNFWSLWKPCVKHVELCAEYFEHLLRDILCEPMQNGVPWYIEKSYIV